MIGTDKKVYFWNLTHDQCIKREREKKYQSIKEVDMRVWFRVSFPIHIHLIHLYISFDIFSLSSPLSFRSNKSHFPLSILINSSPSSSIPLFLHSHPFCFVKFITLFNHNSSFTQPEFYEFEFFFPSSFPLSLFLSFSLSLSLSFQHIEPTFEYKLKS